MQNGRDVFLVLWELPVWVTFGECKSYVGLILFRVAIFHMSIHDDSYVFIDIGSDLGANIVFSSK